MQLSTVHIHFLPHSQNVCTGRRITANVPERRKEREREGRKKEKGERTEKEKKKDLVGG